MKKLIPSLAHLASEVLKQKESKYPDEDINNRIVYLPYSKEESYRDIDSLKDNRLIKLKKLISVMKEHSSFKGIKIYEINNLQAFKKEFDMLKGYYE
ncbi:hypothetical protein PT520_09435 [Aliarcobacter butzleri]|uniref:Uncharacterized protein n=1 Tax=Aliarcobacter butzleri TaxID=28197 RepID=A0AAW6VQ61_9BACT|nr:hypothetical protein [Aliarcobacter butzleri]MDK2062737.1 hypothetical protein [Aliarcobacter butzleri]